MLYFVIGSTPSNEQEFSWHVGESIPRIAKVDHIYADGHELEYLQRLGFVACGLANGNIKLYGDRAMSALQAIRLDAVTHRPTDDKPVSMENQSTPPNESEENIKARFEPNRFGLGDVVSFGWKDGWDQATVNFVHPDGTVDLFRPYVQTADFSYTGGVICYIGIDTDNKRVDPSKLKLVRKGPSLR